MAAFNSVDKMILIKKMKYYGIKGKMIQILNSYLEDRHEFVELESTCSKVTESLHFSVIQNSRMSGILYTLYTNDVPLLHKLIEDENWLKDKLRKRRKSIKK